MFAGIGNPLFGEVMRRVKQTISDSDIRRTWILLGDPILRLKSQGERFIGRFLPDGSDCGIGPGCRTSMVSGNEMS
jgi:hypothetical protein